MNCDIDCRRNAVQLWWQRPRTLTFVRNSSDSRVTAPKSAAPNLDSSSVTCAATSALATIFCIQHVGVKAGGGMCMMWIVDPISNDFVVSVHFMHASQLTSSASSMRCTVTATPLADMQVAPQRGTQAMMQAECGSC